MSNYSPVGDLMVVSICMVVIVLISTSYIPKTRSFKVFAGILLLLMTASLTNVGFFELATSGNPDLFNAAYSLRILFHSSLFFIFLLFVVYISDVTRLEKRKRKIFFTTGSLILATVVILDIIQTLNKTGLNITLSGIAGRGAPNIFLYGYVAFSALEVIMMFSVTDRVYSKVMYGFFGTIAVSFFILFVQGLHDNSSYTVGTFLFPVIAMFYLMHSNPYDLEMGSLDIRAFEDIVSIYHDKKKKFVIMSLYMHSINDESRLASGELRKLIRKNALEYFKDSNLFQAAKGHAILVFPVNKNHNYEKKIGKCIENLHVLYDEYTLDYKLAIGESIEEISVQNEYIAFLNNIFQNMDENTVHYIDEIDVHRFNKRQYILQQLEDIYARKDLNDPRVAVYCQPVLNIKTKKYDTAEALMRLKLDDVGIVYPDQFIPIAEERGSIHVLTQIILNKTCHEIRSRLEEGYNISRISVNVSATELKSEQFCDDVIDIIKAAGIPGDKIAIELTESQTEYDFHVMKDRIDQLKEQGIKFYLDDFGTGYSNMERIMELPFDIIKFDRSLVLACDASERSREMVTSLAQMFSHMDYYVLYEGIEEETEEIMCTEMAASFLQGYKYSMPIPIGQLSGFLEKNSAA